MIQWIIQYNEQKVSDGLVRYIKVWVYIWRRVQILVARENFLSPMSISSRAAYPYLDELLVRNKIYLSFRFFFLYLSKDKRLVREQNHVKSKLQSKKFEKLNFDKLLLYKYFSKFTFYNWITYLVVSKRQLLYRGK